MMWTSDGSEILDYNGDLDAPFEWCRFLGTANLPHLAEGEGVETSLHQKRQDYMENSPLCDRRKTRLSGLSDATVYFFPESGCECLASVQKSNDDTPIADPRFTLVRDEVLGTYLKGEHIDGEVWFLTGYRDTLK